jgi:hypothetical protein
MILLVTRVTRYQALPGNADPEALPPISNRDRSRLKARPIKPACLESLFIMSPIRKIVRQALATGYLTVDAEEQFWLRIWQPQILPNERG